MKKCAMIALLAGTASVALAAPHESVTFTGVGSFNRWGVAGNSIMTATFTGTYSVAKINITGTMTPTVAANFARESSIQATTPTGQKFIITPFSATTIPGPTNVPAGAFTQLPVAEASAAGTWTFEFFETYDDNAASLTVPDSTWDTITFTLDDATVAPPPAPIPTAPSATFSNLTADLGFNNASLAWTTMTFTVPPEQTQTVDTVVFSGMGTGTTGTAVATANNLNGTPTGTMLVRVSPPWAPTTFTARVLPLTNGTTSSTSTGVATFYPLSLGSLATLGIAPNNTTYFLPPYNSGTAAAASGPAAGTWTVQVMQNFATATDPAFKGFWQSLSMSLTSATPPAVVDSLTLLDGGTVTKTGTFTAAGEKKWYKFTVPAGTTISRNNGNALDISMFGTNLTPVNDTSAAVYSSAGTLLASNFTHGPGSLPHFSWGSGIRNPYGLPTDADPGIPFDGANPGAAPPNNFRADLTAGDYYMLINNGDTGVTFRTGLFNSDPTTDNNTGPYTILFRSWLTNNTAPTDVPNTTDLGTLGGPIVTRTTNLTAGRRFEWFKFTIPEDANDTTGKYIDIDTVPTPAPLNDTNIAVYDSTGTLKGLSDDVNAWTPAVNPTGGNSALSFGSSTPTRDYTSINADLAAYPGNGVEGALTAGTYYLQVSTCCANYTNNNFWVVNDYATTVANGPITVNLRNNYPVVGSPCGLADVGSTGGAPGFDSRLDNNDFVVYIDYFFNHNPIADMGTTGGVAGADGVWDNNDFVVYIDYFFTAPASCR